MEEVQIQSMPSTLALAPTTLAPSPTMPAPARRSLPRYERRQIDNTDLLDSIDRVTFGLIETLTLVESIPNQSIEQVPTHHNRSN